MAYPEPIPALRGPSAKEFIKRLEKFKLSDGAKKLFAGARKHYRNVRPREERE